MTQLNKDSFLFLTDSDGREYGIVNQQTLSKNIKASLSKMDFSNISQARLYDKPEDRKKCPLTALKIYLSKIPEENKKLFPMISKNNARWYCTNRCLGKNALGMMMKNISKQAKLSKSYTNHCVRVTVISELSEQGFTADEIATHTGHKKSDSVLGYIRHRRDGTKRKLAEALQIGLQDSSKVDVSIVGDDAEDRRIEVNMPSSSEAVVNFNVNFSGNFTNCVFGLGKNAT